MAEKYGRHLSFPFRIGKHGQTEQVDSLEAHLRDELVQLILTNPGERAFLPEFGGGVRRLVFENIGESTASMTKATVTQAVSRWLGHRIELQTLTVETRESEIEVSIAYRIAGTEDTRVMKFQHVGEPS